MRHEKKDAADSVTMCGDRTFESILNRYLSRLALRTGEPTGLALAALNPSAEPGRHAVSTAGFAPWGHAREDRLALPEGYAYNVILRWGDPIIPGVPEFDPRTQTAWKQARQFGYNCNFVSFMPLPYGTDNSTHGLIVVTHESTCANLMFPVETNRLRSDLRDQLHIELAAHGVSIVEVIRDQDGTCRYAQASEYNRRLTGESRLRISGPAAGHPWIRTSYDTTGLLIRGTLSNCSGGTTPWGTVLTCERNFETYFYGDVNAIGDAAVRAAHQRYGIKPEKGRSRYQTRFDLMKEPHEPFRFGWVVEIDPYDPQSMPVKRTMLGRFKHEAAQVSLSSQGHAVVYSGDHERFEYLYKFVSSDRYDPDDRTANMRLLNSGTLYVARFGDDGSGEWLPLSFGHGQLTKENGFTSQAEVLINTRYAADLLGATKMDRPEDIEVHLTSGKVYIVMTNHAPRRKHQAGTVTPRRDNRCGYMIELMETGNDHAATSFTWSLFVAGNSLKNTPHLKCCHNHPDMGCLTTPDNLAFDNAGRMWLTTGGQQQATGTHAGVCVVDTEGPQPGNWRHFLSGPPGCEISGPAFTPDHRTFFVAVQHPGDGQRASFERPLSRWPDDQDGMPPRPSVVAIYRKDWGLIGT